MICFVRYASCFALLAAAFALLSACAPPDRWEVFQDPLERRLQEERSLDDRLFVPDRYQPEMAEKPPIEFPAQGPVTLSIEQAAVFTLQQNRELAIERLNPVVAGTFEQIERGVYDPEVFAELAYERERASQTDRATGSQFSVIGDDVVAVAGVRQALPTGTDIEATIGQDRTASNRSPEQQTARLGLTVTQQLLRGFGPAVNLASIRQAQIETVATVHELRGFTEALLADTEIAYWNYVLAREEIAIFEESLQIARQQRDQIEQRIDVGVLPETEAASARAEVALREQALIDARSALNDARLRLLRLINPSQDGTLDIEINATSDPRVDPAPINNLQERIDLALAARPDLREAKLRLDQNRLETIVTRNGLLPRLELFIALGKTGFDTTIEDSFKMLDEETYDVAAGVRFSHLLGNRAAEARNLQARTERRQAARSILNLQQLVRLDVRLAANEVQRARQQISASAATRSLQEAVLQAERERFDVGTSTALLVAQAQRDLLESQIAEVEAIVNYRIALVNLYLAEGSLLQRRGITIAQNSND